MKHLTFLTALCTLILMGSHSFAQDFSNRGKDFWLAYTAHIDGNNSRMALYISSDVSTTGSVNLNGSSIPFSVTANQATVVQIFPTTHPVINAQNEGVNVGKGIHITAQHPVVVYAHILNSARSGSSLILPTNTLGRDYIASSFRSSNNSGTNAPNGSASGSQFTVVAVENNTTIEVTPSAPDVNGTRAAGTAYTVNLNKGDVYQFRTSFSNDVTGSRIRSLASGTSGCKPIAVFSGSSWTSMDCANAQGGDNLYQQLMPRSAWGKNYVTAPFANRQYDVFRIIVSNPGTTVTLNGSPLSQATLINNTYYQFTSSAPNVISSSEPVMLVQYMTSQTCDSRNGGSTGGNAPFPADPEMIIINPIEQTVNDVTVVSARRDLTPPNTNITKHFFTIIMKANASSTLRIDGNAPSGSFVPIGTSGYVYLHEDVTNSTTNNPSHRIKADSGFIALAYGLGNVESYGYNAGTNVRDLYQFVSIKNEFATVNYPASCAGSPFNLSMTFPYQPTEIKWQFNGLFPDITVTAPVYDSTWTMDGRQLYLYKLPATYRVSNVGVYPIKVVAQNPTPDGCGNEQEINYDIQIFPRPGSAFSFVTDGCVSSPVNFTGSTNAGGRPISKWIWDFGDGTGSEQANPSHLYSTPGSFVVQHALISDIGCVSDTIPQTVTLSPLPVAKFGKTGPYCTGTLVAFSDSSTSAASTIQKWNWDFGDGRKITATTNAPQANNYITPGKYYITLEVETASGCKSVVYRDSVIIHQKPVASFDFGNACLPLGTMQFNNQSTLNGSPVNLTYQWTFSDGGSDDVSDPAHNFSSTGPFSATLLVTTAEGCKDDITRQITTVYAQPLAKFLVSNKEVCEGTAITFTDVSTAPANRVQTRTWSFSDGTTSGDSIITKTFPAGSHEVSLFVISAAGCTSLVYKDTIIVNRLPQARFNIISSLCEKAAISFGDLSLANSGIITKWNWTMGDGNNRNPQPPFTHTYTGAGSYIVTLQVETDKGCVSSIFDTTIIVNALPVVGFKMPENCLYDPFSQFIDTSTVNGGTIAAWSWNFGDPNANAVNPNTATGISNPQHKYTEARDYIVSLTATSDKGCIASTTQTFTVNGAIPQAKFSVDGGSEQCVNQFISLTNQSTVDFGKIVKLEILWDVNDPASITVDDDPQIGKSYSNQYDDFTTPVSKTYTIRVRAYSGTQCFDDSSITITLHASPGIQFDAIGQMCVDTSAFLVNADVQNVNGNDVFSGNGITSAGLFTPATANTGSHLIRYTFTSTAGCVHFEEQTIRVNPLPTADAGPSTPLGVLEGGSYTLPGTATGSGLSYSWSPSAWLSNDRILRPIASPLRDTMYTLTVTNQYGCTAEDSVAVKILKGVVVPNVFTPNGDGINDRWELKYLESYSQATVEVYNRYGQLVFRSKGYAAAWDGTYNGKPVPVGTYYYLINPRNGRSQISGFVDILR